MNEIKRYLEKPFLPERLNKYLVYKPKYYVDGCGVFISIVLLLVGCFFIFSEFVSKLETGVPIIWILISPLSTFAFSLVYVSYAILKNFFKYDLRPKNPNVYNPKKIYRGNWFRWLNWLNIVCSLLYIFTNEWFLDGAIWGFLGTLLFGGFIGTLLYLTNADAYFRNQKKYGESSLYVNCIKQIDARSVQAEIQFYSDSIFEYCKNVELYLFKINEYFKDKEHKKKALCIYHAKKIELHGRQTIIPFEILKEHLDIEQDFDKKDGITYWLAEVRGEDKKYSAVSFPEISLKK